MNIYWQTPIQATNTQGAKLTREAERDFIQGRWPAVTPELRLDPRAPALDVLPLTQEPVDWVPQDRQVQVPTTGQQEHVSQQPISGVGYIRETEKNWNQSCKIREYLRMQGTAKIQIQMDLVS